MGISELGSLDKDTIRRRYEVQDKVTPGRVVQLLNNGKINDLPLKAFPNIEHSMNNYYLDSSKDYQIMLWPENIYSLHYIRKNNDYPNASVFRLNEDLTVEEIFSAYSGNTAVASSKSIKLNSTTFVSLFRKLHQPYDVFLTVKTFSSEFDRYENEINITLKQNDGTYNPSQIFKISDSRVAAFLRHNESKQLVCFVVDINLIDSTCNLVNEIVMELPIEHSPGIIQIKNNKYLLLYHPEGNQQEKRYRVLNIDENGQLKSYGNETIFEISATNNTGRIVDYDYEDLGQGEFLISYDSYNNPLLSGVRKIKYFDDNTIYFDDFIHSGKISKCRLAKIDEDTIVLNYTNSNTAVTLLSFKKINGYWIRTSPAINFNKNYAYYTRLCKLGDRIIMPIGYNYDPTYTLYMIIIKELLYGTWLGISEDENQVLIKGITNKVSGIVPGIEYRFDTDGKLIPNNSMTHAGYLFNQDQIKNMKSPMKAISEKELYLHSTLF